MEAINSKKNEILPAAAALLLAGTVADGNPSEVELSRTISLLMREFSLSRSAALKTVYDLLESVKNPSPAVFDEAGRTLVANLSKEQRRYFLGLVQEILKVDGKYEPSEHAYFLHMYQLLKQVYRAQGDEH